MRSGFVALIGRPNVGKSSLLNEIINYKLSIVSTTPQTTRNQIKGIYTTQDCQIVFLDTPGIHKPLQEVGHNYNEASYDAVRSADLVLFLTPLDEKIGPGDLKIINQITSYKKAALITKLDKLGLEQANKRAQELKELGFQDVLATSLKIPDSIKALINFLTTAMPEGPFYYPAEELTDKNMSFLVKEMIRESVIELTKDELPHSIGILIDDFQEKNILEIKATIYVERNSQKGIIIGKNGQLIKKIGINSRAKIRQTFGLKNILNLKVKVAKKWTKDHKLIKKFGY